jgi:hypothetical protein
MSNNFVSICIIIAFFVFSTTITYSSEADYFTNRYPIIKPELLPKIESLTAKFVTNQEIEKLAKIVPNNFSEIPDSLVQLNQRMNKTLDDVAMASSLPDSKICNKTLITKEISDRLGGALIATIERSDWREGVKTYGPINPTNDYGTIYTGQAVPTCCADILKINGHFVSADKLGHFIVFGHDYWVIANKNTDHEVGNLDFAAGAVSYGLKGIDGAIKFGENSENGVWGILSGGVYSNGDLAANFDGMHFWQELTSGSNPYFSCKNGIWKHLREFDWSNYVSDAWDEAINCSHFRDKTMEKSIALRVELIQKASGKKNLKCPVEPDKCSPLLNLYPGIAQSIISSKCLDYAIKLKTSSQPDVGTK